MSCKVCSGSKEMQIAIHKPFPSPSAGTERIGSNEKTYSYWVPCSVCLPAEHKRAVAEMELKHCGALT